ncbi:chemotaxis protein CheW [bacterium]|nr:chemotaxis protein CheW [bacterium]
MNNKNTLNLISKTQNNNYIIFKLNEKKFALDLNKVTEIINLPEIEFIDKAPEGYAGIFKYNGEMINIIDLKVFLNLQSKNFSVNNKLIIINLNEKIYSILCDSVINITKFEDDEIQELPFDSSFNIAEKLIKLNSEIIYIISFSKVLEQLDKNFDKQNTIDYKSLYPNDEKSKQILKIRAQKNEIIKNSFNFPISETSVKQYVMFTLGEQNYFLDLKYVKEFMSLKRLNITPLPYTKDFIKGIVNIKGDYLVVIDLKRFLRNDLNILRPENKLIITHGENFDIAFMVDDVKYIKALDKIQNFNQDIMHNSEYILAEFTEENELYSILNFEKIINDEKLYINIV